MLDNANFLFEIGCEEIPAGYFMPALESIKNLFKKKLEESRIGVSDIEAFATPRRIALLASGMDDNQKEEELELKGPSMKAAYDDKGNPSKALAGFIKGNKISIDDVFEKETEKGLYIFAKKSSEAKAVSEVLPGILLSVITGINFPKKMKWSDKEITFPRPISYFLVLFNNSIIPFELSGIESSNRTRGHYIQHNKMIEIGAIAEYGKLLEKNGVILDHHKRREHILRELKKSAEANGGILVEDDDLLETVTFLTENPSIVECSFNTDFLAIPDIVLITEMKEHQKYFAITDAKGKLLPKFLVVSNNPPTDYIRVGNERVIAARFSDAQFFFAEDRKSRLIDQVEGLKKVLFHKELGTVYDKIERMDSIGKNISKMLKLDKNVIEKISRAILLSKADLNTALVFEFTSLQGKIGKIYALLDNEDPEVAGAIEDHYKPGFQNDNYPEGTVSIVLSIAEKIDNIFGSFSVGNIPKGSQDPYALRRQANAIVEMLITNTIHLDLHDLLEQIADQYKNGGELVEPILEFITARARTKFQESGFKYDEINACLSIGSYDFYELHLRARSINEFRSKETFSEMLLSFKRMNNIVSAFRKKNAEYSLEFKSDGLVEDSEKDLHLFFNDRKDKIAVCIEKNQYADLFTLLIDGKPVIDVFFDKVMVMVDDVTLRDNRLALIENILAPFKKLIDFSQISE